MPNKPAVKNAKNLKIALKRRSCKMLRGKWIRSFYGAKGAPAEEKIWGMKRNLWRRGVGDREVRDV